MTPKKILATLGVLTVGVGVWMVSKTQTAPLPRIDVNMFCTQTMSTQPQLVVYSGTNAATVFQYGYSAVRVEAGTGYSRNGVGRTGGNTCSSPITFVGDCWQSVVRLAATPDTPKWLVATGAPNMCFYDGLAVWKWKAATSTWDWNGFISNQTDRLATPMLNGDVAWASQNKLGHPEKFSRFDLNTMTATRDHAAPQPGPVQTSIQGYTYTIHAIHPNPIPPVYMGPTKFYWQREGGPAETPTAVVVTPIKTATPPSGITPPPPAPCPTQKPCPTANPARFTPVPTRTSFLREAVENMS